MLEVKNYDGQIYLKGDNLKDILSSNPLYVIPVGDIVIFFSNDISLTRVKSLLKHAVKTVDIMIEVGGENNGEEKDKGKNNL